MSTNLDNVRKTWDRLGKADPLWAIATDPTKRGNRWDTDDFFKDGEFYIAGLMAKIEDLGVSLTFDRALDFGCGFGRLTQALCQRFKTCYGVDISPSMIAGAIAHNRFGSACQYIIHQRNDLSRFDDDYFSFVCSYIVLQHMAPELSMNYIREFVRVVRPGGLVFFQLLGNIAKADLAMDAYAGEISLLKLVEEAPVGQLIELQLRIRNLSHHAWPACAIKVGNHWRTTNGDLLVHDDGRTEFDALVAPLESRDVTLTVTVPAIAGDYVLELDLVQEGVCWFADRGLSKPIQIPFRASERNAEHRSCEESTAEAQDDEDTAHEGTGIAAMEVHGVDRQTVTDLLEDAGACILHIHDDGIVTGWESYHYFVTKDVS